MKTKKFFRLFSYILALGLFLTGCGSSQRQLSSLNTSAAESLPNPVAPVVPSSGSMTGSGASESGKSVKALYLGVAGNGSSGSDIDHFRYRFKINDKEYSYYMDKGGKTDAGYDYRLQNTLREGYMYNITVEDGTITDAAPVDTGEFEDYKPVISGEAGVKTVTNLIKNALSPVGCVLFVYGGGHNWQNTGSGNEARSIGLSQGWIRFFKERNEDYTYRDDDHPDKSYYPDGGFNEYCYAGLDSSGYLGWVIYNTFEKEDMKEGFVTAPEDFAKSLSDKGWGLLSKSLVPAGAPNCFKTLPGDIVSIKGHVWMSLGTCSDGSTLILHSTPSPSRRDGKGGGVQIGAVGNSKDCEAYKIARNYMARYYPDWYSRYNVYTCNPIIYFDVAENDLGCFSWDTETGTGLKDPDGIRSLSPAELLSKIYK